MAQDDDDFPAWLQRALDFGFQNFCHGDYRPTILLQLPSGELLGSDLVDDDATDPRPDMELILDRGRQRIKTHTEAEFYALIWNGAVDEEPEAAGGVFVEAGSQAGKAVIVVQAYQRILPNDLTKLSGMSVTLDCTNLWNESLMQAPDCPSDVDQEDEDPDFECVAKLAFDEAAQRLIDKSDAPFLMFLYREGETEFVDVKLNKKGDKHQQLVDARMRILDEEEAAIYALVSFQPMIVDEKPGNVMIAEIADRLSSRAYIYLKPYALADTPGSLKVGRIELHLDNVNMWNDPEFDADEDESEDEEVEEGYVNIDTLEELANHVFEIGARQLTEDCEDPFAFLITKEAEILVHELPLEPGHDVDEVLNEGRNLIAETHDGVMAALVYYATLDVDGQTRDVMVAEVEERDGEALMYAQTYDVLETTDETTDETDDEVDYEIEVGEPFVVNETPRLWSRNA